MGSTERVQRNWPGGEPPLKECRNFGCQKGAKGDRRTFKPDWASQDFCDPACRIEYNAPLYVDSPDAVRRISGMFKYLPLDHPVVKSVLSVLNARIGALAQPKSNQSPVRKQKRAAKKGTAK